jgi:hypothetical protein
MVPLWQSAVYISAGEPHIVLTLRSRLSTIWKRWDGRLLPENGLVPTSGDATAKFSFSIVIPDAHLFEGGPELLRCRSLGLLTQDGKDAKKTIRSSLCRPGLRYGEPAGMPVPVECHTNENSHE